MTFEALTQTVGMVVHFDPIQVKYVGQFRGSYFTVRVRVKMHVRFGRSTTTVGLWRMRLNCR